LILDPAGEFAPLATE
jgi:hypothetical protein